MSMNVNTTGTVYGSYQNTYKAGTVDKKKKQRKQQKMIRSRKCDRKYSRKNLSKEAQKCLKICVAQEQIWTLWLQILKW